MTVNGTVVRSAMLLAVSALAAAAGWVLLPASALSLAMIVAVGGAIGFSVWAHRRPLAAKWPAFAYALMQGALVGAVSRGYASAYDGLVVSALAATAIAVAVTLLMFTSGVVKVTAKFRAIVFMATAAAMAFYLVAFVLGVFGVRIPGVFDAGLLGVGFSLLMVTIACANLFVDYQVVAEAVDAGADERFEWFAAFGIVATVLWVYLEMLRLLSKLR